MVEVDEETIDLMKKIKDAIKGSAFDVNRFEVFDNGLGENALTIDVRKKEIKK
jgi:hypothetical protein